jgi:hypothetical protein
MESGKTYATIRDGNVIYISMTAPDGKRPASIKYKYVGDW